MWLQVEIMGQLSGQMAELMGGMVETFGEDPHYKPEIQHKEEEGMTEVTF